MYVCLCVCGNRLEREIAYIADFFQSQVPRTKRYPVYSFQVSCTTLTKAEIAHE